MCDDAQACVVRESPINVDNFVPEILGLVTEPAGQVDGWVNRCERPSSQPMIAVMTHFCIRLILMGMGNFPTMLIAPFDLMAEHIYDRPGRYTIAVLVSDQDSGGLAHSTQGRGRR